MSSTDDDVDWGEIACDPTYEICSKECDPLDWESCPLHAFKCYPDRFANETAFGCDCDRYVGCTGPYCNETSPAIVTFMAVAAFAITWITLPTIIRCAVALYKLRKAGKLNWSATVNCILYNMLSATFGWLYLMDSWLRKNNTCAQSEEDGGTDLAYDYIISSFTSLFAMFIVLAIIQILLMWIDVYSKSKSMQKAQTGNSLLEVYKKALRIYAGVFVVVFFALYMIAASLAVLWTFFTCIVMVVLIPIAAMNLVQLLTGSSAKSKWCCASFCGGFLPSAVGLSVCGRRTQERKVAMASSDEQTAAGKFTMTRLRMAEMVEKTAIRCWLAILFYLISAVGYVIARGKEPTYEPGELNAIHFTVIGIFSPLLFSQRSMLRYCTYTLRDVLDEKRQNSAKVSAGMSVASSTTVPATEDEDRESEGNSERLSGAM